MSQVHSTHASACDVQTYDWRWDYARGDWHASLSNTDGDAYSIRSQAERGLIRADVRGGRTWYLLEGCELGIRADSTSGSIATFREGWLWKRGRIAFADSSREVVVHKGTRFGFTLSEQIAFDLDTERLLTIREQLFTVSGKRVCVTTTPAGEGFEYRSLLVVVGFYRMNVEFMNRS